MSRVTPITLPARLVRVKDGDTVVFTCDLRAIVDDLTEDGYEPDLRVAKVDTPETDSRDPDVKARALAAKQFTATALTSAESISITILGKDKYGRRLGHVSYKDTSGSVFNLADELLKLDGVRPIALAAQLHPDHA